MTYLLELTQAHINGILLCVIIVMISPIVINVAKPSWRRRAATDIHVNTEMKVLSIECAINAIITADANGTILQWNKGAERMIGYKEEEVLNKNLILIIPARFRERHLEGMQRMREYGATDKLGRPLELTCLRKNGTEFPISLKLSKEIKGTNIFFVGVIRDMTADMKSRAKTKAYIDLYQTGEQIAGIGTWRWNVTDDQVEGSKEFKRIFDEDEEAAPAAFFLQKVWKGHRAIVDAKIREAIRTGTGYEVTYGVVRKDGTIAMVLCKAIIERRAPEAASSTSPKTFLTGIVQIKQVIELEDLEDFDILNNI